MLSKSYNELILIPTYEERLEYLRMYGKVGEDTFGFDRYLNQIFYHDDEWKSVRNKIIMRDADQSGNFICDLGIEGLEIVGKVYVHHINPILKEYILERNPLLFDPNNLICCSKSTHDAIHYGSKPIMPRTLIERRPNDTCPWRK